MTTAAAAPKPHVERARAGAVEAVFSYSYDAAAFRFSRQRLTITRDGVTSFSARLRKPPGGGFNAQPAGYFSHKRSVLVTDVDGDGEPEVVLDLYWGGAHCCWYSQIYRYVPAAGHYTPLVHVWGNFGYVFADLDHDRDAGARHPRRPLLLRLRELRRLALAGADPALPGRCG